MNSHRLLVGLLLLLFSMPVFAQDARLPVPDRKDENSERKRYEKGFEQEAPDLETRVRLMLSDAVGEKTSPARRWALLEDVMKLALKSDEFDAGLSAAHKQADYFEVDRAKVVRDFVTDFNKSRRSPRWSARGATALIETGGLAWVNGDKTTGKKLLGDAEKQLKKFKQVGLFHRIQQLEEILKDYSKLEAEMEKAGEETSALDRALKHLVGSGDVASASLALESSEDAGLKAIGEKEGARPSDTTELLDLADLWWQEAEKRDGDLAKAAFRARALNLAVSVIGRTNSEQDARLAAYLSRPQYRCVGKRLLLLGEHESGAGDDFAIMQVDEFIRTEGIKTSSSNWRVSLPQFPELHFSPNRRYLAAVKTSEGELILELHPEAAPKHVSNFIYLSRLRFYDDLEIHRIIKNFMAQLGCPLGNGQGGPGYQFDGELETSLPHDRTGMVSMANAGPGTDGCQFFITFTATPHLDGKHTAFGRMLSGKATLNAMEAKGSESTDESGKTSSRVMLESIRILVL